MLSYVIMTACNNGVLWRSGLEELYASHCHLVDLKQTITRYPALQILDISFNQIDNVEQLVLLSSWYFFGNISSLCLKALSHLQYLRLCYFSSVSRRCQTWWKWYFCVTIVRKFIVLSLYYFTVSRPCHTCSICDCVVSSNVSRRWQTWWNCHVVVIPCVPCSALISLPLFNIFVNCFRN